jgi:hypothetical protein
VKLVEKTEAGKRICDWKYACYSCKKLVSKLARHLSVMHKEETAVVRLLATPLKARDRIQGFTVLERAGDFNYNCKIIQKWRGELIVTRRLTKKESKAKHYLYQSFGPYPCCSAVICGTT